MNNCCHEIRSLWGENLGDHVWAAKQRAWLAQRALSHDWFRERIWGVPWRFNEIQEPSWMECHDA